MTDTPAVATADHRFQNGARHWLREQGIDHTVEEITIPAYGLWPAILEYRVRFARPEDERAFRQRYAGIIVV